jgi:hypothetical protein
LSETLSLLLLPPLLGAQLILLALPHTNLVTAALAERMQKQELREATTELLR